MSEHAASSSDPDGWIEEPPGNEPEKRLKQKTNGAGAGAKTGVHGLPPPDLRGVLDVNAWAGLDIPPEPRLCGGLITPTTRLFLVGSTGIGKTLFGYGMVGGMADGKGFLYWNCDRPSRWLIIDGEMPSPLIKRRSADLIRRRGGLIKPHQIAIYSADRAEEWVQMFPGLGAIAPLNTPEGQEFVQKLVAIVKPDGVMVDNVMSLIVGDQKEEIPWSETWPLVFSLTKQKIAQVWLDHAGHNGVRQYGSSTKAWRMDAVGVLTATNGDERAPGETSFTLSFEPPYGKARRRTPENWTDFATHTITLRDDEWTWTDASPAEKKAKSGLVQAKPSDRKFHDALLDALAVAGDAGGTTEQAWISECERKGLLQRFEAEDDHKDRSAKRAPFRTAKSNLIALDCIAQDGTRVTDLTSRT
jgi:hypothetical protein